MQIALKQILRVYRFGMNKVTWERPNPADSHFLAYKLSGQSTHEQNGTLYPFKRDMVMFANQ